MARITIEVPDNVASSLRALASAKGVTFENFTRSIFVCGLPKFLKKHFKDVLSVAK